MGVITQRSAKVFYGLGADRTSIPVAALESGDLYVSSNTGFLYQYNGVGWEWPVPGLSVSASKLAPDSVETLKIKDLNVTKGKAELGFGRFVERLTNAVDFTQANFTVDGNDHVDGLDLTGIVPEGAVAVMMEVALAGNAAGQAGTIRRDAAHTLNRIFGRTQVGAITIALMGVVSIDSDRLLDYNFAVGLTAIAVTITGWYI